MKDNLKKTGRAIRRHAPVVIVTASVTALAVIACTRKGRNQWHALVLDQETRDAMAASADVTVAFKEVKMFVTGKPWNPEI